MKLVELKQFDLPDSPGVYFFLNKKGEILYVGKASSIKDRVKSYFARDILLTRSPLIAKMLHEAEKVEYMQTDSVLEALILEANQIKKHQPPANSRDKDDKSYNFVVITKEKFPRILVVRGRELKVGPWESVLKVRLWKIFGPFPHAVELKEALKIIRKIFPYRDDKCKLTPPGAGRAGRPCFNAQIGLCPGPCAGWISKSDYRKQIRNIKLFFEDRKGTLIKSLEKEMKSLAKEQKFEEAEIVKRRLFALDHIQDVALIKADLESRILNPKSAFRIEAYDVAHISGTSVVGVMTVVEDGELSKSQYRKFKIRADNPSRRAKLPTGQGNNDVGNLKQVLSRRFAHPEWKYPNLIVVDGGRGQINAARQVLKESGLDMIEVVSVLKDEHHRAKEIISESRILNPESARAILLANSEAHRFAIGYHRKLRSKGFRI